MCRPPASERGTVNLNRLHARQEVMATPRGEVLGTSYRWPGGQYCAIHTDRGLIGCGLFDVGIATQFGIALAIARGTPERPLCEPEDLLGARIAEVSEAAAALGILPGMTGDAALGLLLGAAGSESLRRT